MASKGHRQCWTPGCTNIVSKRKKKKGAICSVCEKKLREKQEQKQPTVEAPSLADRLAQLEKRIKR